MKNLIISRTFSSNHVVRLFKTQSRACNVRLYMRSQLNKKEIEKHQMRFLTNDIIALDVKYPPMTDETLDGALRGIIVLHEIYNLGLERFIKGDIRDDASISNSRKTDSLKSDDLALMAVEAFNLEWYDNSVEYINSSTNSIKRHVYEKNEGHYQPSLFEKAAFRIRRNYAKYRNNLLLQRNTSIAVSSEGIQWKLFSYLVDEGSYVKKPNCIIN